MFDNFLENSTEIMSTNPWLAFVIVFLGGLMTAANPCVIASIPLLMGYIGGTKEKAGIGKAFSMSMMFAIGLAIMFTVLGITAALMGRMFGDVGVYWKYIIGIVCLVMAVHLSGLFEIPIPAPKFLKPKTKGILAAFILGLGFGIISAPCAAPILIVILAFIASDGSIIYGGLLLLTYSIAHCALILVAGTSMGLAQKMIDSKGLQKTNLWTKRIAALLIFGVGIYIMFIK